MGRVVALMDDLFFQMKLAETAKQLGVEVKVATNGEALMELMESAPNFERTFASWDSYRMCSWISRRRRRQRDATKCCRARASRRIWRRF